MKKKELLAIGAIAGAILGSTAANASTLVTFGDAGTGGGTITSVASGSASGTQSGTITNIAGWSWGATASFLPGSEDSNSANTSSSVPSSSDLYIFVTFSGLTGPLSSALGLLSSFTLNSVTGSATVTETTYIDPNDSTLPTSTAAIPGTELDSSGVLSTIGTVQKSAAGNTGTGPYSITEEYEVIATGNTLTNATIDLTATPLPAALPLFAGGLGFMGLFAGRRKRKGASLTNAIA
jgi:hypothetical protein